MTAIQASGYLWMALCMVWFIGARRTKRTQQRADFISRLSYGIPVLVAFALMFADSDSVSLSWLVVPIFHSNTVLAATGVTLTALGVAFAIWARLYIGQNWSSAVTIKVGHQLIRTGPYGWVRHPIYSGILLAMLGTALVRRQPRGVIAFLLLWLAFLLKSRMEERFMRQAFGPEYDDYIRTTGALVPRIHF